MSTSPSADAISTRHHPGVEGRLNRDSRGSVVPRRVGEVATGQRGVVAHHQLVALAVSEDQITRWLDGGRLLRLHEGVYAVGHRALPRGGHFMAAVLAGGGDAALSHCSGAAHMGLRPSSAAVVDVMVPRSGERDREGIRFHRPKIYGPEDRWTYDGIPCTTVARTLVDLGAVLKFHQLERAVEQAEVLGVLDVKAIADVLARISRPRGVRNLRRCLGAERLDASLTQSVAERDFLTLCRDAGFPRPALQHPIEHAPGRWHHVDFAWPDRALAIEIDGWAFHGTRTAARRDRRLDREIRAAGWRVERFMRDDLVDAPEVVLAALHRLLATSRDDSTAIVAVQSSLDA
jgi:very-short-patch-repair endonuclease